MSDPFIGEIRMFGGNYAPMNWAFCDGAMLAISQYDALFSLIGTTYGGNGTTTFALPDFRGRLPLHQGRGPGLTMRAMGQAFGSDNVTLVSAQMPAHAHDLIASSVDAVSNLPTNAVMGGQPDDTLYTTTTPTTLTALRPDAVGAAGGSLPHSNDMPFQCVNFIISLFGIYPSRS